MYVKHGLNTVEIAERIGCHNTSIGRLLRENGIKPWHTPSELKLSKLELDDICEKYINGMTTIEIGKEYGICDRSVANILRRNGVSVRKAARRSYVVNHDYFHSIDSMEKAYFLGWMVTDGSVIENNKSEGSANTIRIELQSGDKYIIEKFAEELGAPKEQVKVFNKRNHAYFSFSSKEMSDDLAQYGIVPRKTFTAYLPIVRNDLMPHLIRGVFDGNGTITYNSGPHYKRKHPRIAFYGTEELCTRVRDYLHSEIGLAQNKVSKSTCFHVWWSGDKQCKALYDYMYRECEDYYLTRKKEKFEKLIIMD